MFESLMRWFFSDYDIYYGGLNEDLDDGRGGINVGCGSQFNNNDDPEYFGYECLTVAQIKDLLSESIAQVCATIQVKYSYTEYTATIFRLHTVT